MIDIACIGELVIDLVPLRHDGAELRFVAKPGGAPGNVAVGAARLGRRTAMLSKVGGEAFGNALIAALRDGGVDTGAIRIDPDRTTGLAVVTLTPAGDRDFFFYRDTAADTDYAIGDLDHAIVRGTRVLHLGSLFLDHPIAAATQRAAVRLAREAGARISADPNLRPALWRDRTAMRDAGREVVRAANIVKISAEELEPVAGTADIAAAVAALWHDGTEVIAVTSGDAGASLFTPGHREDAPGFRVDVVDTVGSGDAFLAVLLDAWLAEPRPAPGTILRRACAAGALAATKAGGMESLPTAAEIDRFLAHA